MKALLAALLFATSLAAAPLPIRHYGMRINVPDLDAAVRFYNGVLGFKVLERTADRVRLDGGDAALILGLSRAAHTKGRDSVSFALLVHDVDAWIEKLRAAKVTLRSTEKLKEGIGFSMPIEDPFGNTLSLLQVTVRDPGEFTEPHIYNMGVYVADVEKTTEYFTTRLPFVVLSRKYLPRDLPLGHDDRSFAFMLHEHRTVHVLPKYPDDVQKLLLFTTPDLAAALPTLRTTNVELLFDAPRNGPEGRYVAFRDADGIVHELIERR